MQMSINEIEEILQSVSEHYQLEFKEAKTQYDFEKTLRYCVAIANEGGGKFILGVTDKIPRIRACYQHCGLKYVSNEKMTNESLRKRFNLSPTQSETSSRIIKDTLNEGLIKLDDPENISKRYSKYIPSWA